MAIDYTHIQWKKEGRYYDIVLVRTKPIITLNQDGEEEEEEEEEEEQEEEEEEEEEEQEEEEQEEKGLFRSCTSLAASRSYLLLLHLSRRFEFGSGLVWG